MIGATAGILLVVIGSGLVSPVYAQTVSPTPTRRLGERIVENRCEIVTNRVQNMITKFDTNKQRHIERHTKVVERVKEVVTKLKAKGYDTSKLETDLVSLETKVREFATLYSDFIAKLKESQTLACGNSEGAFKAKLDEARQSLKASREKAKEITNFIKDTIIPDLRDLKSQKPVQAQ